MNKKILHTKLIIYIFDKAKDETIAYYKENPGSYSVVVPTDLIMEYLNDIEELLNK